MRAVTLIACCLITSVYGVERILSFKSDITIHPHATLTVVEDITIQSAGISIKHGIVREIPTRYKDAYGMNYIPHLRIESITHNGLPTHYTTEEASNGILIYIGSSTHIIPAGKHQYIITYTIDRTIGFFASHDELYWNATGNGWSFPIMQAEATIHLPQAVATHDLSIQAYTGIQGSIETDYTATHRDPQTIYVKTTKALKRSEGLTFAVGWPKNIVQKPAWYQEACWYMLDNCGSLWLMLWIIVLVCWMLLMYQSIRRQNKPGIVIPQFHPPAHLPPSGAGYISRKSFTPDLLSADIIHLAVHGHLTIDHKKTAFLGDQYTIRTSHALMHLDEQSSLTVQEKELLKALFKDAPMTTDTATSEPLHTITISSNNNSSLTKATEQLEHRCIQQYESYFMRFNQIPYGTAGIITLVLSALPLIVMLEHYTHPALIVSALFLSLIACWVVSRRIYTTAGRNLQDTIDGFKLFLTTTEIERLAAIGTPPTKTPALYEKYLPYAMALGVEKAWTEQFTPLFNALAQNGTPYTPTWYLGRRYTNILPFSSNTFSNFNHSITASHIPPGSTSGLKSSGFKGGGGFSGGGGGGGGGRGW